MNALDYGERMVAKWLENYMFAGKPNAKKLAKNAAAHFNAAASHKSHGRRIDRDEERWSPSFRQLSGQIKVKS